VSSFVCCSNVEIRDGNALGLILSRELEVPTIGIGNMPRLGSYICKRIEKHERKPVLLAIDNAHLLTKGGIPNPGCLEVLATIVASGVVPLILSGRDGTSAVAGELRNTVGQLIESVELFPIQYSRGSDLTTIVDFLLTIEQEKSAYSHRCLSCAHSSAEENWPREGELQIRYTVHLCGP
jgi:hypothetical protein